ncbi:tripartite motif-containing protein 60-like [Ctenodactylus gundi]
MEISTAIADLQEVCRCPVCLNYFIDPVTINCGHNFCYNCVNMSWKDLYGSFPCPFCRFPHAQKNYNRNSQLRSLTDIVKLIPVRRSKRKRQEEPSGCEKHNLCLTHFCTNDLQLLCTQCSFSPEHESHCICPIESAGPYQRRLLEGTIEPLKNKVDRGEKMIALQVSKSLELKKKVEFRKEEIASEFERVSQFLWNEHEDIHRQVRVEELDIQRKSEEHLAALLGHISKLKELLKEAEEKCEKSDLEVLNCLKSIYDRSEALQDPDPFSYGLSQDTLSLPRQYSGLDKLVKQFRREVFFDPDTANPQLTVSEDRKCVHYESGKPRRPFDFKRFYLSPAVLGSQPFNSGRHYWEVEVGDKLKWTLGVCEGGLPRHWSNQPSEIMEGFCAIGRYRESGYLAFGFKKAQFVPVVKPSKVGIFLDWDLGEVSFYDVNDRSLIYSFKHSFTRIVWPYFYVGKDAQPLKISSVSNIQ